jgi:hypothetical protein
MLLLQLGCATNIGEKTMDTDNILIDKPFYTLKITSVNSTIIVTLNGEMIFEDYSRRQLLLEMPVNHLMTSGENKIEVKLLAFESTNLKLNPKTQAQIALQVHKSGDYENEPLVISRIVYQNTQTKGTSEEGKYNSVGKMQKSTQGDIHISKLNKKNIIDGLWTGQKMTGIKLSQTVTLQTPFPKWKFLSSEKLYVGNYMLDITDKTYKELKKRKDIQALYALVDKIHKKLQAKDTDWVASLFKERNDEMDIAFYKAKGDYAKDIQKGLEELVNDPDYKIFIAINPPFYISEGGRTIDIRSAISYNLKKGSGSSNYKIRFRRENGKWILTR